MSKSARTIVIETVIDAVVRQGDTLRLSFLGEIHAGEMPTSYIINLAKGLQVKSSGTGRGIVVEDQSGASAESSAPTEERLKVRTAGTNN